MNGRAVVDFTLTDERPRRYLAQDVQRNAWELGLMNTHTREEYGGGSRRRRSP